MNESINVGNNIRALRKAYGETQQKLGEVLGVEKNTVSYYETGQRKPDKTILTLLSQHYMVSVEELLYSDLTCVGQINVDKDAFWKNIRSLFPQFKTDISMQNEHFKRAYRLHDQLYSELIYSNLDNMDNIFKAIDEYEKTLDDEVDKCATSANIIALAMLIVVLIKATPLILQNRPALVEQLADRDVHFRKALSEIDPESIKELQEVAEIFDDPEMNKELNKYLKIIKHSPEWSDLADYYIALKYLYNIESNDLNWGFNQRIGIEIMSSFASLGNKYAIRYIRFQIGTMRKSSQSVDDK